MTDTKPELKACPFCGGSALIRVSPQTRSHGPYCNTVGCLMVNLMPAYPSGEHATHAWNTRPAATGEKTILEDADTREDSVPAQCTPVDAVNSVRTSSTSLKPAINDVGLTEAVKFFRSPNWNADDIERHAETLINHAVKGGMVAEVTIKKHLSDDDYTALVASVRKHLELGMNFGDDPMEQIVFLVHRCLVEHGTIKIIDGAA